VTGDNRTTAWQQSMIVRPRPDKLCHFTAVDTAGETLHCTERWGHAGYHAADDGTRWSTSNVWSRIPIKRQQRPNYLPLTDPVTGTRHGYIRYRDGNPPTPFGCRWCGIDVDNHDGGSIPGRPHTFTRPTCKQQKLRMIARRKNRKATT
jgi:hypothetical protein